MYIYNYTVHNALQDKKNSIQLYMYICINDEILYQKMFVTDLRTHCDMQSGDTIKTTNAQQPPHNQQSVPDVD